MYYRLLTKLFHFFHRYIGVLNVTFEKQQKRKASARENTSAAEPAAPSPGLSSNGAEHRRANLDGSSHEINGDDKCSNVPRIISQSLNPTQVPTPTVTFADNRHIIPRTFLQSSLQAQEPVRRSISESTAVAALSTSRSSQSQPPPPNSEFTFRPTLSDKHAVSWGATTVNKKLRNEVFGEAFLQQPIPIQRHRRPAHQHRPLAHRPGNPNTPSQLRSSNSESSLLAAQIAQSASAGNEESMRVRAMRGAAERNSLSSRVRDCSSDAEADLTPTCNGVSLIDGESELQFKEKAATSAPVKESPLEPYNVKRKRRYSSGGLRRKPEEDAEDRGDLKYFEEADDAGYKGDGEYDLFQMDPVAPPENNGSPPIAAKPQKDEVTGAGTTSPMDLGYDGVGMMLPASRNELSDEMPPIPRPVNPKQAQTQPDERVEFFLLLEDLTAGMRRPCIMDLKMGTRQYGVDANEKKQRSQRRKCEETTSRELGVRVCGLQVWDVATQSYIFKDKYFGRDLKAGREFQEALTRFLYDGVDYSSVLRHIPTILHKLSQLEVLIRNLYGYRFYAASLLMFYDGELDDDDASTDTSVTEKDTLRRGREIDFKIADFANCVTAEHGPVAVRDRACPPQYPDEPDKGFLRGLRSLRKYFLNIQKEINEMERGKVVNCFESNGGVTNGNGMFSDDVQDDLGEVSY